MPVEPARRGDVAAVLVGAAEHKRWWRHFRNPAEVEVWGDGRWQSGVGRLQFGEDSLAAATYRLVHPGVALGPDSTFVLVELAQPEYPMPPLHGHRLARLWFWIVTLAEFTGFAVPAVVGTLTADAGASVQVPALLAAGLVEGGLLGLGQASVLRLAMAGLPSRRWISATAVAAAFGYGIGLLPALFADSLAGWHPGLLAAAAVLAGAALCSIGTAQWLILRRYVDRAGSWIRATAIAWLVGLAVFAGVTTPLWQPGQPLAVTIAIGMLGGLLMAATTSAITGRALRRIIG